MCQQGELVINNFFWIPCEPKKNCHQENFEFPPSKHEMVCLTMGKYKYPPISHRFFFNGEFSSLDEK
jgi:hypothetical protein